MPLNITVLLPLKISCFVVGLDRTASLSKKHVVVVKCIPGLGPGVIFIDEEIQFEYDTTPRVYRTPILPK